MIFKILRVLLFPAKILRVDKLGPFAATIWPLLFRNRLGTALTGKLFEFLLKTVNVFFLLSKDFRRNIADFTGKYVFTTEEEPQKAAVSVIVRNGKMIVTDEPIPEPDVAVIFKNADILRRFLFSRDLDAMDPVLENKIQIDGNWNYVHKFLAIVKDLLNRLGF